VYLPVDVLPPEQEGFELHDPDHRALPAFVGLAVDTVQLFWALERHRGEAFLLRLSCVVVHFSSICMSRGRPPLLCGRPTMSSGEMGANSSASAREAAKRNRTGGRAGIGRQRLTRPPGIITRVHTRASQRCERTRSSRSTAHSTRQRIHSHTSNIAPSVTATTGECA
jgi:hypothetical protein